MVVQNQPYYMPVKCGPSTDITLNFWNDPISVASKESCKSLGKTGGQMSAILEEAKTTSTEVMILCHELPWTGHVVRMPCHHLPKHYSQLKNRKQNVGGQQKRFKDGLKANLKNCGINTKNWEALALECSNWRSAVTNSAVKFEEARMEGERKKCVKRKVHQAKSCRDHLPSRNQCPHCRRTCGSRIGLYGHLWTCPQDPILGRQSYLATSDDRSISSNISELKNRTYVPKRHQSVVRMANYINEEEQTS